MVGPVAAALSQAAALAEAVVPGTALLVDAAYQCALALHLDRQVQTRALQKLQAGQPAFRQGHAARDRPPVAEADGQAGPPPRPLGHGGD